MKKLLFFITLFLFSIQHVVAQGTILEKGDIVVLGGNFRNNNNSCNSGSSNYYDNIYLVAFVDIEKETLLDITDNGYNRVNKGFFGTGEAVLRIKRTGNQIPAGQIFSININGNKLNNSTSKIGNSNDNNGWSVINLNTSTNSSNFALSGSGDQFFLMQGGSWTNSPQNEGQYDGNFLSAYNSRRDWLNNQDSPNQSGFLPELNCYYVDNRKALNNTTYRNFGYYKGSLNGNFSQGEWLIKLLNSDNWENASSCNDFNSKVPNSKLSITNKIEEEYCFGDVIQPLNVINESTIIMYEWYKSINDQIGDSDDMLVLSGSIYDSYQPSANVGTYYYYCKLSIKGYDNNYCPFISKIYKVTVNQTKTSPILNIDN